jgi:hypothetical protein
MVKIRLTQPPSGRSGLEIASEQGAIAVIIIAAAAAAQSTTLRLST